VDVRDGEDGVTVRVRVQPRASKDGVLERAGALVVRLTAPPVDGAANDALVRFLGKTLGVAPSEVRVVRGASSRDKTVAVAGLDADATVARLRKAIGRSPE
jgi:uncharacterized protein